MKKSLLILCSLIFFLQYGGTAQTQSIPYYITGLSHTLDYVINKYDDHKTPMTFDITDTNNIIILKMTDNSKVMREVGHIILKKKEYIAYVYDMFGKEQLVETYPIKFIKKQLKYESQL